MFQIDNLNAELMRACTQNSLSSVVALLSRGANAQYEDVKYGVNVGSCFRISPIHQALKAEVVNIAIVKALLDSGASPDAKHEDCVIKGGSHYALIMPIARTQTPLHIAILVPQSSAIVKLLLDYGADVDAFQTEKGANQFGKQENSKETALHILCRQWKPEYQEIISVLIEKGANIDILGNRASLDKLEVNNFVQETALHIAVKQQNVVLIKTLVAAGANRNIQHGTQILDSFMYESVWELAYSNKAILDALKQEWSVQFHKYFPRRVKSEIKSLLLVAKRQQWNFDIAIMHTIFSFIAFN